MAELVAFVRTNSRYYANKYRHLPAHITEIQQLPRTLKPDLVRCFDDRMADLEATRTGVQAFIADKSLVGHHYLGRYCICTTSGTTGVSTMLVHGAGMTLLSGFILARLRERTVSLIIPIVANGAWGFFLFLPRMI